MHYELNLRQCTKNAQVNEYTYKLYTYNIYLITMLSHYVTFCFVLCTEVKGKSSVEAQSLGIMLLYIHIGQIPHIAGMLSS